MQARMAGGRVSERLLPRYFIQIVVTTLRYRPDISCGSRIHLNVDPLNNMVHVLPTYDPMNHGEERLDSRLSAASNIDTSD